MTAARTYAPHRWRPVEILGAAVLVALGLVVTSPAWQDILRIASRSEEQSHVYLVPVIAVWLAWVRRGRLRKCPRDGRLVGPLFVALGWVLYSLGDLHLIEAAWHLGAVVIAVGCFLSFAGARYLVRLLPAFAVLAFLVPVPGLVRQQIALPLQTITAEVTQHVLGLIGVEASRSGNALSLNGVDIFIAEACNGLRMVTALFLVTYAFAYSLPLREPVRLLILVLSPFFAILCNVIRLVPTVWVHAYVSEEAGRRFHDLSGWVMLPVAFLMLLGSIQALRWALVPVYRYTLAYGK